MIFKYHRAMIVRREHEAQVRAQLEDFPVVAIVGARQVGKTTLARRLIADLPGPVAVFDLEDPTHERRLADPKLALAPLRGLVVIDEVQRHEGIFRLLRVLVDRPDNPARFLILGSASPALLRQSSESLAGRIAYHELPPFRAGEVGTGSAVVERLWLRGGFPRSFFAGDDRRSMRWRSTFIRTFLERDLPQLGVTVPAATMRRFWTMVAHYHGSVWNNAELARALGVTAPTVMTYLDALVDALVVRRLVPWFENLKKRQVKAPKVYLADSGLLHALLGLESSEALLGHPKSGLSWEGFALHEVVHRLGFAWENCYYWGTHGGAELDLLALDGGRRRGFEFKRASAPQMTRSMHAALADLKLDRLFVIFPGDGRFPLHEDVEAIGLERLVAEGL